MKSYLLFLLAIALTLVPMPFVAEKSVAKSDGVTVSVRLRDGSVEAIDIEDYVLRVLAAREDDVTSLEAKKAFAVAVRSCATYFSTFGCKHSEFDACSDGECCIELGESGNASESSINAVNETRGVYLTYDGAPAMALFTLCASSGTKQSDEFDYLVPVVSGARCEEHRTERVIPIDKLLSLFPFGEGETSLYTVYGDNEKVEFAIFGGRQIDGDVLTSAFDVPSVELVAASGEDGLRITSYGAGHGYGLDLCNAERLARGGLYYKKILEIYFPSLKIE